MDKVKEQIAKFKREVEEANERCENLEAQLKKSQEENHRQDVRAADAERKLALTQSQLDALEERVAADNSARKLQDAIIRAETAERKIADMERQMDTKDDALRTAESNAKKAQDQLADMLRELGIS
eukprot:c25359_g1_i1.p4 GENE.c25359_g1_i1~~c25359_g1_i1.p4  ORF type:complete len:138 (+),score=48.56 c25359_g1_i1:38-415(+)